jgi:hypothetical protein
MRGEEKENAEARRARRGGEKCRMGEDRTAKAQRREELRCGKQVEGRSATPRCVIPKGYGPLTLVL